MRKGIRNTLVLSLSLFLFLGVAQTTQAVNVDYFSDSDSDFETAVADWKTDNYRVVENFDDPSSDWYNNLNTNVGNFSKPTDTAYYGEGDTSDPDGDGKFKIQEGANGYGRYPTEDGVKNTNGQYLDSADNAVMTLDLTDYSYRKLGFYITDPSDVGAWTKITAKNGGSGDGTIDYEQDNASLHFVGISTDSGHISEIIWETFKNDNFKNSDYNVIADDYFKDDGWGVSEFTRVPEPATLLLLGTGLVGFAGFARRRRSRK